MQIQTTIDRLTAEKMENRRAPWQEECETLGRIWVKHDATVEQLQRLPEADDSLFNGLNDDNLHGIWHSTVYAVDDRALVREFWGEWLMELHARGYPVEEVSVYDFTLGACEVRDKLMEDKPDLFQ